MSLSISIPKASSDLLSNSLATPDAIASLHLTTTASITCFVDPLGPGRRTRLGENISRYFCFVSILWNCSSADDFRTMADRKTRAGRINKVHKPATKRSAPRRFGARFRPTVQIRQRLQNRLQARHESKKFRGVHHAAVSYQESRSIFR